MPTNDLSIGDLEQRVKAAKERLEEATATTEAARREETDRLNAYNEACKEFDAAVAELRKQAPRETDWQRGGRG